MNPSPDIIRDFSALQSDVVRLSKFNVELVNELIQAQADVAMLCRVRDKLREERDKHLARALRAEGETVSIERERDEAREERDRYKRMWDESRMETVEAAK